MQVTTGPPKTPIKGPRPAPRSEDTQESDSASSAGSVAHYQPRRKIYHEGNVSPGSVEPGSVADFKLWAKANLIYQQSPDLVPTYPFANSAAGAQASNPVDLTVSPVLVKPKHKQTKITKFVSK